MKRFWLVLALMLVVGGVWGYYHITWKFEPCNFSPYVGIAGDYALMTVPYDTVYVFDVSDDEPQLASIWEIPGQTLIEVQDQTAYTLSMDGERLLRIYDLSNPLSPELMSASEQPNILWNSCCLQDDFLITRRNYGGQNQGPSLAIVDVSDPEFPQSHCIAETSQFATCVARYDDIVYTTTDSETLLVLDVGDPDNPQELAPVQLAHQAGALAIEGERLFVLQDGYGVEVFDISAPETPSIQGTIMEELGAVYLEFHGDEAFVVNHCFGVSKYDMTDILNPVLIGYFEQENYISQAMCHEDRAFLSTTSQGVHMVDMSDPAPPSYLHSRSDTQGMTKWIAYNDGIVFLVDEGSRSGGGNFDFGRTGLVGGLLSVDVSDASSPQIIGMNTRALFPGLASFSPSYAFLYDYNGEMIAFDLTDLDSLGVLSCTSSIQPSIQTMCFSDGYLYGASIHPTRYQTCWSFNYTDFGNPQLASLICPGYSGYHCECIGDVVIFSCNALSVLDVSSPDSISYIGSCGTGYPVYTFATKGDYLFGTGWMHSLTGPHGLSVVDISNPAQPVEVGSAPFEAGARPDCCAVSDTHCFIADNAWNQILVYDISAPTQPELVETIAWNLATYDMWVEDGLLYTANGRYGMHILDLQSLDVDEPAAPQAPATLSLTSRPNPFNPTTAIAYDVPADGRVKLEVFNVRGQRVTTLVNDLRKAGTHEVVWNAGGVGSGVYFVRLQTGGDVATTKLLLLK